MSKLVDLFSSIFKKYFDKVFKKKEEYDGRPQSPLKKDGEQVVEVNLFRTRELDSKSGLAAEQTIATYLANIFERAGLGYKIRFEFDPIKTQRQNPVCSAEDTAFYEWDKVVDAGEAIPIAKDSNVLLCNGNGGGCGWVGGNVATAPAASIYEYTPYQESGEGNAAWNIQAALHEIGHNIGGEHDYDDEKEGQQHYGMGWNEDGKWHQTPGFTQDDIENACGEYVEKKQSNDVVFEHYYHDCFIENFIDIK